MNCSLGTFLPKTGFRVWRAWKQVSGLGLIAQIVLCCCYKWVVCHSAMHSVPSENTSPMWWKDYITLQYNSYIEWPKYKTIKPLYTVYRTRNCTGVLKKMKRKFISKASGLPSYLSKSQKYYFYVYTSSVKSQTDVQKNAKYNRRVSNCAVILLRWKAKGKI